MTREQFSELGGWIGIALIQGATLPSMIGVLAGWSKQLPPLSMVLLIWSGLALFLYRSYLRKDFLGVVSNAIGWLIQSLLLAVMFLKG